MAGKGFTKGKPAVKGSITDTLKTAKQTGLAVSKPMDGLQQKWETGFPRFKTLVANTLQQLSALAALDKLTPEQLSQLHDDVGKSFTSEKSAMNAIATIIKARTIAALKALTPTQELPSGTRRWVFGGMVKELRVQKTGLDPKLVEAQLRARAIEVTKYMQPDVRYIISDNDATEKMLLDDKVFTHVEIAAMRYDREKNVALMPSKPVGQEDA